MLAQSSFSIPMNNSIYIKTGTKYIIRLTAFKVDNEDYQYGGYRKGWNLGYLNKSKNIYMEFPAGIALLMGENAVYPINMDFGLIEVPSGNYKIIFNTNPKDPDVLFQGEIILEPLNTLEDIDCWDVVSGGITNLKEAVDCSKRKVSWITDQLINSCNWGSGNPDISNVEFGNIYDRNSSDFHCYYFENEICDKSICNECTEENVFNLMVQDKQFIAPTEESGAVISCSKTNVGIPCTSILGPNPVITTVHHSEKAIVNYTLSYEKGNNIKYGGKYRVRHFLHPGQVQRKIFSIGNKVYVATLGEGSGVFPNNNLIYAVRTWTPVDNRLRNSFSCSSTQLPTLFLFDLSGSMSKSGMNGTPKIIEAQSSAKSTLQTIRNNNRQGINQSVGIRTFSGGCPSGGLDPRRKITQNPDFITDLNLVESYINNIGSPKGGTPLKEAVEASEDELNTYLISNSIQEGKLIILSDGEATCGKIRPNDVYAYGQTGKQVKSIRNNSISTNQSGTSGNSSLSGNQLTTKAKIKYYAVGFNVAPGSAAERDLQYLTQSTGGKYLNAQNQFELTRAFEKFSKIYVPKSNPTLSNLSSSSRLLFENSFQMIKAEEYTRALSVLEEYTSLHQKDCNGVFNLALMLEANELYNSAIQAYSSYLNLCPNSLDKEFVLNQIDLLEEDYRSFLKYNNEVVQSDLEYLNQYFQKIQNGESITLAREFIAFIKEKGSYYQNLPQTLEIESRIFKINSEEVFRGLAKCVSTINRNPHNWDRDATPILSMTYLNMERLLKSFPKGGN